MLDRELAPTLRRLAQSFPAVAVTGPRQSGKTTLVRQVFADKPYVSLENPAERAFAEEDPKGFLARFPQGAVFDEAQRWPDLFSWLQGLIDEDRQAGRFILTGSQQFGLLSRVTQSLAGRVGMTRLLPLSISEWRVDTSAPPSLDPDLDPDLDQGLDQVMRRGGYPELHVRSVAINDWFASYVATYLERDVRQLSNIKDILSFQRFIRLCAGRTGQLLNLTALASEAGISQVTARSWLSVLEASDLVFRLPPYHKNYGKRLVKTPKLYFVDVGLACWLLGIQDDTTLSVHPLRGALFETLIISECLKFRFNQGLPADIYFWRDNNGLEADLVFERQTRLQSVEIKSGKTITSDYVRAGQRSVSFAGQDGLEPWVVYGGDEACRRSGVHFVPWMQLASTLALTG
jgi:predicted AAA+ superfamily ATPase